MTNLEPNSRLSGYSRVAKSRRVAMRHRRAIKLGVKGVILVCGVLLGLSLSKYGSPEASVASPRSLSSATNTSFANSTVDIVEFCSDDFNTMAERFEQIFLTTNAFNAQAKKGCEVDNTDYSSYPLPWIDPCSFFGFLPYCIGLFYTFVGLAVVCDEFFVPALEQIVENFNIGDDVAGATLMAAGGSAPELFTSIMGTFLSKSNVGFGTIVGSAVFNVLFVIAMCALFSKEVLTLTWWPLARDSSFYTLSLCTLAVFYGVSSPNTIELWEAVVLLLLYVCYVLLMKFNERLHSRCMAWLDSRKPAQVLPDDDKTDSAAKYLLQEAEASQRRGSVENPFLRHSKFRAGVLHMMYSDDDVLDKARVHVVAEIVGDVKTTFREIDKDGSGYIDSSELSEMLRRLMRTQPDEGSLESALKVLDESGDGKISLEEFSSWYLKSEERVIAEMRKQFDKIDTSGDGVLDRDEVKLVILSLSPNETDDSIDEAMKEFDKDGDSKIDFAEFEAWYRQSILWQTTLELIQEDEETGPLELEWPDNFKGRCFFVVTFPIVFFLWLTIPDVRRPNRAKYYPVTWLLAILWIAFYSYFMVWWATLLGDTAGIPPAIMGLTFLAAGTSIPDLLTSVIVARQGLGDMAVSSSIGSNIFDILIGLPFPWLLHNIIIGPVTVGGDDLLISVLVLIFMLVCVILTIAFNKWRMTRKLGFTMLLLYAVFLAFDLGRNLSGC